MNYFNLFIFLSFFIKSFSIHSVEMENISQKPIFCNTLHWNLISSRDICKIITPIIKNHLKEFNYDRFSLILQYIRYYESLSAKNPSICPLQTLESFTPDLTLGELKGSSCFALNMDLLSRIPSDLFVYPIPARLFHPLQQPYWPNYSHVALIIPFFNPEDPKDTGYILLDPHLKMETPTILSLSGKKVMKNLKEKGVHTLFYKKGKIISKRTDHLTNKDFGAVYYLTQFKNSIESSLKPILAADRKITLYSRNEKGEVIASLILMLDTDTLRTSLTGKTPKEISFSDFLSRKVSLEDALAEGLKIEKEKLHSVIEKILLHKNVLDDLYRKYTDFVELHLRAEDFYIPKRKDRNC